MPLEAKVSPYVLGIDFGTTNSVVAVVSPHSGKTGEKAAHAVEIEGDAKVPSVVFFQDQENVMVGRSAKRMAIVDPDRTISSVKRNLGDLDWKREFFGRDYWPTDVATKIFEKLLNAFQAQDRIDLKGTPKYAVVCIPANSDDTKKKATIEAAKKAGLNVLQLLEEPTAAAIAYGSERGREQTIMVYDLGGGTFDCTILELHTSTEGDPSFVVKAKEGIATFGGDDFDDAIVKIINDRFKAQSGIDLLDESKDQGISIARLRNAHWMLKEAAENAKKEISDADSTDIILPNLVIGEDGTSHSISERVTREEFETSVEDMVRETRHAIERALKSAELTIQHIDKIVLVGGSTRVPIVKRLVSEMWGREPYQDVNPDTCIAQGAAIFGASLILPTDDAAEQDTESTGRQYVIEDKVSHYLGVETAGRRFSVLIEKGLEIDPERESADFSKTFTTSEDDISSLRISTYQSMEKTEYVDDPGVSCIGEYYFDGIPPAKKGEMRIAVTFRITHENLLEVSGFLINNPEKKWTFSVER
jgi:molecular chaperone DnaK